MKPHTRPTEDLDFFTAPERGHVPAARDALEAAALHRDWSIERIHDLTWLTFAGSRETCRADLQVPGFP